ncbi:MAG: GPR endopeptidase, partial [Clostridia bacterium]|nr:GPR endopeptidase [Clostridia bacterium]
MDNRFRYKRTDLASECKTEDIVSGTSHNGIVYTEKDIDGFKLSLLDITDKRGEDIIGKPVGRYVTVDVGKVWTMSDTGFETCTSLLSDQLSQMLARTNGGNAPENVLVVGLGNRYITSDALGHETLKNVIV